MQVTITAVGPDNRGLADPIVHYVTGVGANIHEIQMYDHDSERLFAMLLRIDWPTEVEPISVLRERIMQIGTQKGLTLRVWAREEYERPPRIAICTTYRSEPAEAVLNAIEAGVINATPAIIIGNRDRCKSLAERYQLDFQNIGDDRGNPDNARMVELFDTYEVDYVLLARYMRVLPPSICWSFAGGRIINLHHGLLPSYPGFQPYEDAFSHHMLTFGATIHFIIPELDAGNQIIHQNAFTVSPGTSLKEIKRIGETEHEPECLVEGVRRVIDQEVELHFHRVVGIEGKS